LPCSERTLTYPPCPGLACGQNMACSDPLPRTRSPVSRRLSARSLCPSPSLSVMPAVMETQPWPSAEDLDGWCVDMSGSPVKDEIQRAPSGPAAAGLRPGDRRPHRGSAGAGGFLGRGGAPGLRGRMAAGPHGGLFASKISPRSVWATARSTPCYAWTRSSSPSSQTPPTASYRRSLGPADVRC
jgi:hypothetical protein